MDFTPIFKAVEAGYNIFKHNKKAKEVWENMKKDKKNITNTFLNKPLSVLTIGPSGNGKTKLLNRIFNLSLIECDRPDVHGTREVDLLKNKQDCCVDGLSITIYDSKGLESWGDPLLRDYVNQILIKNILIDIIFVVWNGSKPRLHVDFWKNLDPLIINKIPLYYILTKCATQVSDKELGINMETILRVTNQLHKFPEVMIKCEGMWKFPDVYSKTDEIYSRTVDLIQQPPENITKMELSDFHFPGINNKEARCFIIEKSLIYQEYLKWLSKIFCGKSFSNIFPVELKKILDDDELCDLKDLLKENKVDNLEDLTIEKLYKNRRFIQQDFNIENIKYHLMNHERTRDAIIHTFLSKIDFEFDDGYLFDDVYMITKDIYGNILSRKKMTN